MKKLIKQLVKSSINFVVKTTVRTVVGRYFLEQISVSGVMSRTRSVLHQGVEPAFVVPNVINHYRFKNGPYKHIYNQLWYRPCINDS